MNKSTIKNAPNPTSSGSGEGKHDLIDRQAAIDAIIDELKRSPTPAIRAKLRLEALPSAQPELIAQDAYVRGFEQGRTQGMVDSQGGKKQRKVLITTTYNEMGIIIDTKAEEVVQPDHVADIGKKAEGDCISRQAVVKFFNDWISCLDENCHHQSVADMIIIKNDFKNLPSVQPESKWIPVSERLPDGGQKCLVSDKGAIGIDTYIGHGNPYNWKWYVKDYEAWMPLPEPYRGGEE